MGRWRPLSKRGTEKAAESYDALHPGIPEWLAPSVQEWIRRVLEELCETQPVSGAQRAMGHDPNGQNYRDLILDIQRTLRFSLDWGSSVYTARRHLLEEAVANPTLGLDVLDYLLGFTAGSGPLSVKAAEDLESILADAGSKWRVSAGKDSLEERVAPDVAERAAELTTSGTRAGEHLRDAWHSVYGRSPNPSHAYREAIRAVEVAAIPVVSPNNTKATLGTVIGEMKATPTKWRVALHPTKGDPVEHVIGMMELLWTSQLDRHGTADESVPLSVSKEEAEAAVHLALTLVHWFQSGTVRAK